MSIARRRAWFLLLPLLLLGSISLPARTLAAPQLAKAAGRVAGSQVGTVQVQVDAGFATYYRPAAWVPIRVRLTNTGPQFAGRIRVVDAGQQTGTNTQPDGGSAEYTRSILLPQGAVQAFTLYVPGADLGQGVTVRVEGAGPAIPTTMTVNPVPLGTILAGVLSRGSGLLAQLKGGQVADAATTAVRLDAATLDPNPQALASFDLLVIEDFNSCALSRGGRADQAAALEAWVRAGGTLVELGGPTAQGTVSCLPTALQLVSPGEPLVLSRLPGLAAAAGAQLAAGQYVAGVGHIRAGTVLLDQQGYRTIGGPANDRAVPLVLAKGLGLGNVVYSAIDPTLGNLAGWSGLPGLWRLLAGSTRAGAATTTSSLDGTQPTASGGSGMDAEIDNVSPPSVTLFIALLILYVVVLVPLNFILLGRFKRRDFSWFTLPAVVVLLVGFTFGSAYYGRSRNVRASVASTVFLTSGSDRVLAQHYVGIFAPVAGDYTLASDDPALLGSSLFLSTGSGISANPPTNQSTTAVFEQQGGQASLPRMGMWTSRNAILSGVVQFRGGLSGAAAAQADGSIRATLTNTTGATIYGVVLDAMGSYQTVGDVGPGKTIKISVASGAPSTNPAQGQSASDYYSSLAALVPAATNRPRVAMGSGGPLLASLSAAHLAGALAGRLADLPSIPTNPDETRSNRFARILAQAPIDASPASLGPLVLFGWSAQPISGFAVNGDHPHRQDTNLLVQSLPLALPDGPFRLNAGTLPARLAGSDTELQPGGFGGGGGFTINSQSNVIFAAQMPLPASGRRTAHVRSLTLSVYQGNGAGGALSPGSAALYDWRVGRWEAVDASTGEVTVRRDPGRFIDAGGRIRVRLSAQDSSIGIADANSGVAIGLAGEVR